VPGRGIHGDLVDDQREPVAARPAGPAVPGEQGPQLNAGARIEGAAGAGQGLREGSLVGELPFHQRIRARFTGRGRPGQPGACAVEAGTQLGVGGDDGPQRLP
jgi:hypothetical protein